MERRTSRGENDARDRQKRAARSRQGYVGGVTQPAAAAFVGPSRGWVIGSDQTQPGQRGDYVIQATTDGGYTWARQNQTP